MKQICAFAFFALLLVGCGSTNKEEKKSPSEVCVWKNGQWTADWMIKYVKYCRANDRFFTTEKIIDIWNTWGLAYIDGDEIPEMILLCPGEAYGNKVLTIHDGKVVEWNSWRCNATYIPKSGMIENNDGSMGEYWDKVFILKNGAFTEIYNHTDMLLRAYDEENANEFRCSLNGDTSLRVGDEMDCHQYDQQKNDIYTAKGETLNLGAIQSSLPTNYFEPDWQPKLPDGVTMNNYNITLSVR
jgi:hypothetical protein